MTMEQLVADKPRFPLHTPVVGPTGRRGIVIGTKVGKRYQDCMVKWSDGEHSGWIDVKALNRDVGGTPSADKR